MITILVGKSASGKDYIQKMLTSNDTENRPKWTNLFMEWGNWGVITYKVTPSRLVTYTSRPMREGEVDGGDYWFVDKERFKKDDDFVEVRKYHTLFNGKKDTWYYGSKLPKNPNADFVTILDIKGARKFVKACKKANVACRVVYVNCEDEVRVKRAINRGTFSWTEWLRRYKADEKAFSPRKLAKLDIDYWFNNNGDDDSVIILTKDNTATYVGKGAFSWTE